MIKVEKKSIIEVLDKVVKFTSDNLCPEVVSFSLNDFNVETIKDKSEEGVGYFYIEYKNKKKYKQLDTRTQPQNNLFMFKPYGFIFCSAIVEEPTRNKDVFTFKFKVKEIREYMQ